MVKVLFICHGNICRSAAAEVVLKQMAGEAGRRDLRIASAATTREEIGNDIYPPMKKALNSSGYACIPHAARQTVRADYAAWDYIIGMDDENMMDLKYIYGGDPEGKLSTLQESRATGYPNDLPEYSSLASDSLEQLDGIQNYATEVKKETNLYTPPK